MNRTMDYFSYSYLISIENKRKSFTDRKVSLLCNKDSKYCFKNNWNVVNNVRKQTTFMIAE